MVILNRVRTYLEAQLLDAQQQQRGTPDALFSLRRMMELAHACCICGLQQGL